MKMLGVAFGLFAFGSLAAALVLEGPVAADGAACASCGVVEAATSKAPYRYTIRMDDGSQRAVTQGQALRLSQRVRVDAEQAAPTAP